MSIAHAASTDVPWIAYVAAFGTVLASVVALGIAFWTRLREDRQRPVLSLEFDGGDGDDFVVGFVAVDHEQHWLRMRVVNGWGRRSADDVEVLVVKLVRQDSTYQRSLNGYSLPWSNQYDRFSGGGLTRLTIPPGVARHFDLLSVFAPLPPDGSGVWPNGAPPPGTQAPATLRVDPAPADGRHRLEAGSYTVLVAVTARDTDTVYYAIDVTLDGLWWSGDAIREHLKVEGPWVAAWPNHLAGEGAERFKRANYSRRSRLRGWLRVRRRMLRLWRRRGYKRRPKRAVDPRAHRDVRIARGDENTGLRSPDNESGPAARERPGPGKGE